MRKLITLAVFGLTLVAGYSLASYGGMGSQVPRAQWLPLGEVEQILRSGGYEVREIEIDDNKYEVTAIDSDGHRVEIYIDPTNGKILKVEKDDC